MADSRTDDQWAADEERDQWEWVDWLRAEALDAEGRLLPERVEGACGTAAGTPWGESRLTVPDLDTDAPPPPEPERGAA